MRRKFLLAALFAATAHAQTTNWVQFDQQDLGTAAFDASRIQRDPYGIHTYRAWWRADYRQAQSFQGKSYVRQLTLYRVNCDTNGLAQLQTNAIDRQGNSIWQAGSAAESIALPDSLGEEFIHLICAAAKAAGL